MVSPDVRVPARADDVTASPEARPAQVVMMRKRVVWFKANFRKKLEAMRRGEFTLAHSSAGGVEGASAPPPLPRHLDIRFVGAG